MNEKKLRFFPSQVQIQPVALLPSLQYLEDDENWYFARNIFGNYRNSTIIVCGISARLFEELEF